MSPSPVDDQGILVRLNHLEQGHADLRTQLRRIEEGQQNQNVLLARVEARLAHPPPVVVHSPPGQQNGPVLTISTIGAALGSAAMLYLAKHLGF